MHVLFICYFVLTSIVLIISISNFTLQNINSVLVLSACIFASVLFKAKSYGKAVSYYYVLSRDLKKVCETLHKISSQWGHSQNINLTVFISLFWVRAKNVFACQYCLKDNLANKRFKHNKKSIILMKTLDIPWSIHTPKHQSTPVKQTKLKAV